MDWPKNPVSVWSNGLVIWHCILYLYCSLSAFSKSNFNRHSKKCQTSRWRPRPSRRRRVGGWVNCFWIGLWLVSFGVLPLAGFEFWILGRRCKILTTETFWFYVQERIDSVHHDAFSPFTLCGVITLLLRTKTTNQWAIAFSNPNRVHHCIADHDRCPKSERIRFDCVFWWWSFCQCNFCTIEQRVHRIHTTPLATIYSQKSS